MALRAIARFRPPRLRERHWEVIIRVAGEVVTSDERAPVVLITSP
jgi:hypothetical protein